MKTIIVMCPTIKIATQKCMDFLKNNREYLYRFSKRDLMVELIGGLNIYFKCETEGQRVLRGTHAPIVHIDEFPMEVDCKDIGKDEENESFAKEYR